LDKNQIKGAMEAILFTMGEAVEASRLATVLEISIEEVHEAARELIDSYESSTRGMSIIELEDAYQMCTKGDYYEYLVKIGRTPKKYVLTDALLETLSIIAYKQPLTRGEVERIRGVNSDHAVSRLVELGLVEEVGRMDAPGKPMLFGTTEEFLRSFGVKSLDELPELQVEQIEDFRQQAEEEAQLKLDI
jgi:segregation and condensation protein B